jgi:aspartyl-tRNA(Asn)/glutamyl-tRNA(Gln) amidotransferase subunit C
MSVTTQDVDRIAMLARLEFQDEEKETITHQMNDILSHIEKLNELDTSAVEPLLHVIDLSNVFRDDVVKPSLPPEDALKNAPSKVGTFFTVPKVIG